MKTLDEVFERLATQVQDECSAKGIRGVFVMGNLRTREIRYRFIDIGTPTRMGVPDKRDLNYLGIALCKFAMLVTYGVNTGDGIHGVDVIGEVPYKGGLMGTTGEFGYAFSGGPEEEDLALMENAQTLHITL